MKDPGRFRGMAAVFSLAASRLSAPLPRRLAAWRDPDQASP